MHGKKLRSNSGVQSHNQQLSTIHANWIASNSTKVPSETESATSMKYLQEFVSKLVLKRTSRMAI